MILFSATWVSVKDGMPNPGTQVLIASIGGHVTTAMWTYSDVDKRHIWLMWDGTTYRQEHVSYWMLLPKHPEPPKPPPGSLAELAAMRGVSARMWKP